MELDDVEGAMRSAQIALRAAQDAVRDCPKNDPRLAKLEEAERIASKEFRVARNTYNAYRVGSTIG